MPIALILVDALGAGYVSPATLPSVLALAEGGRAAPLTNIYAYRGIEATLFSGLLPDAHGIWGEFLPAPRRRPGPANLLAEAMITVGDLVPSDRFRLNVRYAVGRLLRPAAHLPTSNLIPARLLRSFRASLERPIWEPGGLDTAPTLFDGLRASGRRHGTLVYPEVTRDEQIIPAAAARLAAGERPDFWYIKFSDLDGLGHRHGPDLSRLGPALAELDGQVGALAGLLRHAYGGDIEIVLLSDHGMSAVRQAIDLRPALRGLEGRLGRDWLLFLDSTSARVWCADAALRAEIALRLGSVPGLRVLSQTERRALHVPDGPVSGDLLAACDEGAVIFPDFFRAERPPLGMHGYADVASDVGLPFLAAPPALAALLPRTGPLGHADVTRALLDRMGLTQPEEAVCASWR